MDRTDRKRQKDILERSEWKKETLEILKKIKKEEWRKHFRGHYILKKGERREEEKREGEEEKRVRNRRIEREQMEDEMYEIEKIEEEVREIIKNMKK